MPEAKKRILIIDDERDIVDVMKVKLQKQGFEVFSASDGGEGFQKALQDKPDCILLDIRMPRGDDGFTFLRKLHAYRDDDLDIEKRVRKTPIIVMSAAGQNMKALFQQEGIVEFMEKPFDSEALKNKILQLLSR